MTEIAAYVAEYHSEGDPVRPFGYGLTRDAAYADAMRQIAGADHAMRRHMIPRIRCRALTAEQASEIVEMMQTPWT